MKKLSSKITVFLLAILVLFSSSFVLIDEHYCEGKLENFSLFGKANGCEMDMTACSMENHNSSFTKTSCCINLSDVKQGSIFEKNQDTNFKLQIPIFISKGYFKTANLLVNQFKKSSYFKNHSPPLIFKDILIFIQCFRI